MSEKINSENLAVEADEAVTPTENIEVAAEATVEEPAEEPTAEAEVAVVECEQPAEEPTAEETPAAETQAGVAVVDAPSAAEETVAKAPAAEDESADEDELVAEAEATAPEEPVEMPAGEPTAEETSIVETEAEEPVAEAPTEGVEPAAGKSAEEAPYESVNYGAKTLSELVTIFETLIKRQDKMKLNKEVEAIKAAFYKKLSSERELAKDNVSDDIFTGLENGFKACYDIYRKERAENNARLEKEREENLVKKEAVIADLKALLERQEDINATFPAFREIQNRWRSIGPVPMRNYKDVNERYQLYVEQFYDMVKINRELRDLDFKKNLEIKTKFCEVAEKLAEREDVTAAFKELQKLHDQWKEYGPVAKQYRDEIWERFRAATAIINKKYQAHFEGLKENQAENLAAKTALCEKVEAIAEKELNSLSEWNACSKEIEEIQKQWRGIGFATKKDNQKIYDRFRAACDKFYGRKREYYNEFKGSINDNLQKKIALCEAAEALKSSTDWKNTADQFISLQKQWKEIGAVPRKKSDQIWKRFRAACDEFFAERDRNRKPDTNSFYANLKAKQRLISEIKDYKLTGDDAQDNAALENFTKIWSEIGFVPMKEKENVTNAYYEAMSATFPSFVRPSRRTSNMSARDRLVLKYNELEQNIVTYENNIGFFSSSRNSAPLIKQAQERIEAAKLELKKLEEEIKKMDNLKDE